MFFSTSSKKKPRNEVINEESKRRSHRRHPHRSESFYSTNDVQMKQRNHSTLSAGSDHTSRSSRSYAKHERPSASPDRPYPSFDAYRRHADAGTISAYRKHRQYKPAAEVWLKEDRECRPDARRMTQREEEYESTDEERGRTRYRKEDWVRLQEGRAAEEELRGKLSDPIPKNRAWLISSCAGKLDYLCSLLQRPNPDVFVRDNRNYYNFNHGEVQTPGDFDGKTIEFCIKVEPRDGCKNITEVCEKLWERTKERMLEKYPNILNSLR